MNCTVERDDANGIVTVRCAGKLDTGTTPEAQRVLDAVVAEGAVKVLVDFSSLDFISSAGLRALLITAKKLRVVNGNIRVCGLNATVAEVFQISGFNKMFQTFATSAEARAGF